MTLLYYATILLQLSPCFALTIGFPLLLSAGDRIKNLTSSSPLLLNASSSSPTPPANFSHLDVDPFIWEDDPYKIIFYHKGSGHAASQPTRNPGVSLRNWESFLSGAFNAIDREMQALSGATLEHEIPGNRFTYNSSLRRPAPAHKPQGRKLYVNILGQGEGPKISFHEAEVVLYGLLEYGKIFNKGSKNDQVRMCRFDMTYEDGEGALVANGTVALLIPPPPPTPAPPGPSAIAVS